MDHQFSCIWLIWELRRQIVPLLIGQEHEPYGDQICSYQLRSCAWCYSLFQGASWCNRTYERAHGRIAVQHLAWRERFFSIWQQESYGQWCFILSQSLRRRGLNDLRTFLWVFHMVVWIQWCISFGIHQNRWLQPLLLHSRRWPCSIK